MASKSQLNGHEKRNGIARAFAMVKHYEQRGDLIAAYVLAFSLFEDRVASLFEECAAPRSGFTPLKNKLHAIKKCGVISEADHSCWIQLSDERNGKLHEALWNLDEFTPEDVQRIVKAAKRASNARKQQKRRLSRVC